MTPEHCLNKRFTALSNGDYGSVFTSYHEDAPFLQQFSDCDSYINFARRNLDAITVTHWQCLRQRVLDEQRVECLITMELVIGGTVQIFYELALLLKTADGWRYHSAQKLGPEDYQGRPDQIEFHHFDQITEQIRF